MIKAFKTPLLKKQVQSRNDLKFFFLWTPFYISSNKKWSSRWTRRHFPESGKWSFNKKLQLWLPPSPLMLLLPRLCKARLLIFSHLPLPLPYFLSQLFPAQNQVAWKWNTILHYLQQRTMHRDSPHKNRIRVITLQWNKALPMIGSWKSRG